MSKGRARLSHYRHQREYRKRRYEEHLCCICGKDNDRYPLKSCKECAERVKKYYKKYYKPRDTIYVRQE